MNFYEEFEPACVSQTEDGSLMVFQTAHQDNIGTHDIWFSYYENEEWQRPVNAGPNINTAASEYDGKISSDGNELVFIRSNSEMKPSIFISKFEDGQWSKATHIGPPVSYKEHTELGAVLSQDGNRLYFSSNREGSYNGFDLYYSERIDSGWSQPINLGSEINSRGDVIDAAISKDEQAIIVAFPNELGNLDLHISYKINGIWSHYHDMGPRINTPGNDACPWLGYDGYKLILNSTWEGLISGENIKNRRWGPVHIFRYSNGFYNK